jgi:pimeloyl-ACP methyl ester carboxylesterase
VVLPDGRVVHNTAQGNPGDGRVAAPVLDQTLEKVMRTWTADSRFVLDRMARLNANDPSGRLTGAMNLEAVGVMGHSIGGATAAQFCHDDARCRAGIDIDGRLYGSVVPEAIGPPFLFRTRTHDVQLGKEDEDQEVNGLHANSPLNTACLAPPAPTTSSRFQRRMGPRTGPRKTACASPAQCAALGRRHCEPATTSNSGLWADLQKQP